MAYTLQNLFDFMDTVTNNKTGTVTATKKMTYLNDALERQSRRFDLPKGRYIQQIPLMSGVYQYAIPSGYKQFESLKDNYQMDDDSNFRHVSEFDFWRNLSKYNCVSEHVENGVRSLIINLQATDATASLTLNAATGITDDGTWVTYDEFNLPLPPQSNTSNLHTDHLYTKRGSGSIAFDFVASQSSNSFVGVVVTGMIPKDLSGDAFKDTGLMTFWLFFPSAPIAPISLSMSWSHDLAVESWNGSASADINGNAFKAGWNQVGIDWQKASLFSSNPPPSYSIENITLNIYFAATQTDMIGIRISDIQIRQRRLFNLNYSSDNLVVDGTTGLPKAKFASGLDTSSYLAADDYFAKLIAYDALTMIFTFQIQDPNAMAFVTRRLGEAEADLTERYPSIREPQVGTWFNDSSEQQTLNDVI